MICCSKIIYNRQQNPLFSVEKVLKSFHVTSRSHGFPHSSIGNESACNAGDPGLIPGSGRSAGEGIGCPLQYSWASLVAQVVKNLPAVRETCVSSLGWEDPQEKGKAIWPREFHGLYSPWGPKELGMTEQLSLSLHFQEAIFNKKSKGPL